MKRIPYILLSACLAGSFVGCNKSEDSISHTIYPVYRYLADYKATHAEIPDSLREGVTAMMEVEGAVDINESALLSLSNSPKINVFTPPVDSVFPTLAPLEHQYGVILENAKANSLSFTTKYCAAVVWGKQIPMLFVRDVLLVALNHYLGSDYPGYERWASYQRTTKSPEFLPYDLAEALVGNNYEYAGYSNESTVLSQMLYDGVLTEAKMRLVENADEAHALGYTEEQLQWLNEHEHDLWQALVGKQLLYDVSDFTKTKLLEPAPYTVILNSDAPGRAGRYLGYKIVKSYLEHNPRTSLAQLLSPKFYMSEDVLVNAEYEP